MFIVLGIMAAVACFFAGANYGRRTGLSQMESIYINFIYTLPLNIRNQVKVCHKEYIEKITKVLKK